MNAPLHAAQFDIQGLAQAISHCTASDALRCHFNQPHWDILAAHLQAFSLNSGQVLMEQGTSDRTLHFIESGNLSVHYEDQKSRVRMALVGAGTVLGEGSFFSHQPRSASVNASSSCRLWCLTPLRFTELASRHAPIALELTLALGSVMARRLSLRPRRVAVT
ncbi:MAG: cyclic nucleotide-binding domain-containing protein [Polaromonas sp.]